MGRQQFWGLVVFALLLTGCGSCVDDSRERPASKGSAIIRDADGGKAVNVRWQPRPVVGAPNPH
ncbi:MAG TPA: hypothetical protein VM580_25240 [Labilithrix sp.]|nr:hypothetical protein [Labilithrix sp.]